MKKLFKIRSLLLTLACLALLCSVGVSALLSEVNSDSAQTSDRSFLEGRTYQVLPKATQKTLTDGAFQTKFDQYLSDHIPFRDNTLLGNAVAQRRMITLANILFDFEAYHTYYGSDHCVLPHLQAMCSNPLKMTPLKQNLVKSAEAIKSLMDQHPETNWAVALPDTANISEALPTQRLVNDLASYSNLRSLLIENLSSACTVPDLGHNSTSDYYSDLFRTDYHWQVNGALKAYRTILEAFGSQPTVPGNTFVAYEGPCYGSVARTGLCIDFGDSINDVKYQPGNLSVFISGKDGIEEERSPDWLCKSFREEEFSKSSTFASVYGEYFHANTSFIHIKNDSYPTEKELLIIGDSFTSNMERFFAENYHDAYAIDPRTYQGSISAFLNEHNADVAIVLSIGVLTDESVIEKLRS